MAIQNVATKEDLNKTALAAKEDLAHKLNDLEAKIDNKIENAINGLKWYAIRWFVVLLGVNVIIPVILKKWGL